MDMLLRRLLTTIAVELLVLFAMLFGPAGTLRWWRAWMLLALMVVGSIVTVAELYPRHKDVLEARLHAPIQRDQPRSDKVLVVALLASLFAAWLLIPIDVFRLHHALGAPPFAVSLAGLAMAIAGWWIAYRTMIVNAFAAPAVRRDRRQRVVDVGVYAVVRHPMYAGAALVVLGVPLWLGSWAAALASLLPIAVVAVRAVFEERFLARELDGYAAYLHRVPWRLVPHVW
ncbi:MAG: isoprenylcysteine carboxylmethyltransferase family protein [Deltaproteobacteria bacterium]|nr:isoprenylcysteine carboxylmethyltransferase family protein [Deltaproteobacteria bacterium]